VIKSQKLDEVEVEHNFLPFLKLISLAIFRRMSGFAKIQIPVE
jgi:hypothetical protein